MIVRRAGAVVVAALVLALSACNSSTKSASPPASSTAATTTTTLPALGRGPVRRVTVTFVDRGRPTVDPDHIRNAPTRTLPTDIYIPPGPGPFPLIVHAHGAEGDPGKFTILLGAWARQGYVVAAPAFPLSDDHSGGPTVVGDYVNQALDMRFVIEQVLAMSTHAGTALTHKVDASRVGVSGLSLGGATTYGVAFNSCCRDPHIRAAIIMSGIKLPFGTGTYHFAGTPVLIFHGTADPVIPYKTAPPAYAAAAPPKYFVSLLGAGHAPPYENTPDPHDALVIKVTSDFWNTYLGGNATDASKIITDAGVRNLATMQYQLR
jgi:predicted dienelactone hydrolase